MPLSTTTEELDDSRVRVRVEVGSDQVEHELRNAAQELGKDFKIAGFRKGKVPPQVVLQRVGREAVLDQAVRNGLPGWYEEALKDAGVAAVGDPDVNLEGVPEAGDPLAFTIEVGVRPKAKLGDYKGIEVGRREPQAASEEVDAELERMREAAASLETVEREAAEGDFVVVDFTGYVDDEAFEGGEARGYLLELGSGRLIEGFEEQLTGASAGEQRTVEVTFPEEYGNEDLAGKEARFDVEVKEVKEKRLPGSTTTSPSRPAATTRSTSCARRSKAASASATRQPSSRSSARPLSTPSPPRPTSTSRTSWSTPRPTRCGTAPPTASSTRASTRSSTSSSPARTRRS